MPWSSPLLSGLKLRMFDIALSKCGKYRLVRLGTRVSHSVVIPVWRKATRPGSSSPGVALGRKPLCLLDPSLRWDDKAER